MNLQYYIDKINKKESNRIKSLYTDIFCDELSIDYCFIECCDRLKAYYLYNWLCTDTWVGGIVYFFDDKILCVSSQTARKSEVFFEWSSLELYKQFKEYIISLDKEENECEDDIELINFNEEMGSGYKISYRTQYLYGKALYKSMEVDIYKDSEKEKERNESLNSDSFQYFYAIDIILPDGEIKEVSIKDLLFKYRG